MSATKPPREIAVVGASLAGLRAAEALRSGGFAGVLHLVGDEPHMPYNRPPLSKAVLSGKQRPEELAFRSADALDATWHLGDAAVGVDPQAHTLVLGSGRSLAYDRMLVATGTRARRPLTIEPGQGIHLLRTLDDAAALRGSLDHCRRLVVLGAGFIGAEVAASVRSIGVDVALVDTAQAPLHQAIGALPAMAVARVHREEGVRTHFGVGVAGIRRTRGRLSGVTLTDGTELDADLLVIGIGGTPATEWLTGSGVLLDNGVVCDATLRANGVDNIWAAGDVARWQHPALGGQLTRVEHWTHAAMSGMAAARNMLSAGSGTPFDLLPEFWSDQFDMNIRGIGRMGVGYDVRIVEGSAESRSFVAVYLDHEGTVAGVLGVNRTRELGTWRKELTANARAAALTAAPRS